MYGMYYEPTVFVSLFSLIVKSVSQLVSDDRSNGSEVHVLGRVHVEENALQNASRKLHEVLARHVERVRDGNQLVLDPGLGVDRFTEPPEIEDSPELVQLEAVVEVVVFGENDVAVEAVDGFLVQELVAVGDGLIHLFKLQCGPRLGLLVHPVQLFQDVFLERLPDVASHFEH